MRVVLVDDVEDVAALEGDAQLVAGDVEVVLWTVAEVGPVVEHWLALLLLQHRLDGIFHFSPILSSYIFSVNT